MKKLKLTKRLAALFVVFAAVLCGMTGCGKGAEESTEEQSYMDAYKEYVQSVLDANYHGDCSDYIRITGADEDTAASINEAHAVNLAQQIAELYAIQLNRIPAEVGERLTEVAAQVYKASDYTITEAEKIGETVYVTVAIRPVTFLQDTADLVAEYVEDFNERAKAGDFENMTESQYENEYAEGILEVLEKAVKTVGYGDQVTYRIEIQYNEQTGLSYVAEEDLDVLNQLVLAE